MSAETWTAARAALAAQQRQRLAGLVEAMARGNAFYRGKFAAAGVDAARVVADRGIAGLPFTTKAELIADQDANPPWGSARTEPHEA